MAAAIGFVLTAVASMSPITPSAPAWDRTDCRITTRYDEHFFNSAFFGILHEAGHGMYDQDCDQNGMAYHQDRIFRLAFTNHNRECGRTW